MKRKKWLALGLTAALVMSPVTGVYAQESDDSYETVESGDYDSNKKSDAKDEVAVQAAENSNIAASGEGITGETGKHTTVTGNVTTTGEAVDGVTADGKNTTVTVKGNVTVSGTGSAGVSADNNATVEVTGNVEAKGDNQTHEGQTGGTYIDKWADGVQADNGSKVTVGGNVTSKEGWAIDSHGSDVTVNGDVHSEEGSAINARKGSTITIDGSVSSNAGISLGGIIETTDSTIKITKDVTAKNAWGILAGPGADIEVGGNVSSEGDDAVYISGKDALIIVDGNVYSTKGCAMDVLEQAEAIVKGNVSGKDLAAWLDNSSKLQALGKISSNNVGILLSLYDAQGTGELDLGTIDAQTAISINYGEYKDIDKILAALPEMTVYKMNADNLLRLYTGSEGLGLKEESDLAEKILMEKLQYAIRKQDTSNGKINIAGELTKAKEGQTLTFSVVANDGYEVDSVSAGDEIIPVIKNDNGTYSVTVPRGGGINISAIFKSIKQDPTPDPKPTPEPSPTPGSSIMSVTEETEVVVIPQSWYSTKQQEFQQVVNTIPQSGVCIMEADDLISFNRKTFEAFSRRSDITYVIIYKWNGNTYQTVIPAGYPIMDLLNEDGYCGCLYLNSVFGSTLID